MAGLASGGPESLSVAVVEPQTGVAVGTAIVPLSGCSTTCSSTLALASGQYVANISTFSGPNASGTKLSSGDVVPFTVSPGTSTLRLSLTGQPTSISLTPLDQGVSVNNGVASISSVAAAIQGIHFAAIEQDTNNDVIVGASEDPISATTALNQLTATPSTTGNTVTVYPTSLYSDAADTLTVAGDSGETAALRINYSPFASDDWITFAHDFERTALQPQATGITPTTVSHLQLRWEQNVPSGIAASPVVYDGNVIVATTNGALVDLSASTGAIVWETPVPVVQDGVAFANVLETPTIDTRDGLVFVADRQFNAQGQVLPSNVVAVSLKDGSVVWQHTLPGPVRSATVYADGMVFEGSAGGDPPQCINGGVTALDALTGTVRWTWYVNPLQNPGGGGAVWGPISYDGSHLIFGTGNACSPNLATAQGVVALTIEGTQSWSFVAKPQTDPGADDDVGGAAMLSNGTATFISKDGSLYRVDASTGNLIWSTPLGAADAAGGFASPGTDGSITVIGAGFFPASSTATSAHQGSFCLLLHTPANRPYDLQSGATSYIKAVDQNGNIIWSVPDESRMVNYPAVNDGIVVTGVDNNLTALDIHSGNVLWSYAAPAVIDAGAAIVPSGIYAADQAGNIYAFGFNGAANGSMQTAVRRSPWIHGRPSPSAARRASHTAGGI